MSSDPDDNPIILYDGVCGLCNRLVRFVLKRDKHDRFRFAPLQSSFAATILLRHRITAGNLDTVYVVQRVDADDEQLLSRSDAVCYVLAQLGSFWRVAGYLLARLPRVFRNWAYDVVARNRYAIFGKANACLLPNATNRAKFLDWT